MYIYIYIYIYVYMYRERYRNLTAAEILAEATAKK